MRMSSVLALAAVVFSAPLRADTGTLPPRSHAVLAELFTSQGCSSCPPAEKLFAELADMPAVVTIEWHVDYWDTLVHRGSRWKDPFSSPAFTRRQRDYNRVLRGTGAVYTPQAVVGGAVELVGSQSGAVSDALKRARKPSVSLVVGDDRVRLGGAGHGDVVWVRLDPAHSTQVKGGENRGRRLEGRNVALETRLLGRFTGTPAEYRLPELSPGESCAIFVQDGSGPVLGAAYCRG